MTKIIKIFRWLLPALLCAVMHTAVSCTPSLSSTPIPLAATAVPTAITVTKTPPPIENIPTYYTYTIINSYPHDVTAFTQGLLWRDGVLYESTGRRGESDVRRVTLESGEVMEEVTIDDQYFGEGITIFNDKLYELTWRAQTGFIYDADTLDVIYTFTYQMEGWGITLYI